MHLFVCLMQQHWTKMQKGSLQIFHDIWDCVIYPTTFYHFCIFWGGEGEGGAKYIKQHIKLLFAFYVVICYFFEALSGLFYILDCTVYI